MDVAQPAAIGSAVAAGLRAAAATGHQPLRLLPSDRLDPSQFIVDRLATRGESLLNPKLTYQNVVFTRLDWQSGTAASQWPLVQRP